MMVDRMNERKDELVDRMGQAQGISEPSQPGERSRNSHSPNQAAMSCKEMTQ